MNNCILYLLHSSIEDISDFQKSINLLKTNYLDQFPCDVILFHEKNLNWDDFHLPRDINFIKIELDFRVPYYLNHLDIPEYFPHPTHGPGGPHDCGHKGFTMGYRHMCRFFAGEIYKQEILSNYRYYLRLDTDSFILRKIPFNLFEKMEKDGYSYGYIRDAVQIDNPAVISGLWETTEKFANTVGKTILHIPPGKMYYTNFEIGDLNWFKSSGYMDYYDYIDRNGGIYVCRWGDAPIRYLGIDLFMDRKKLWPIDEVGYQHGGIFNM